MFKIIIFYFFFILTMLNASNIESELGIDIGLNSTKNEDGNKFKNPMIGLSYQYNKYIVAPRVDIDYTKVKDDKASSLVKISINGVYDYENNTVVTPYALAGVGYEHVSGGTKDAFESHPFVQGGAGVKVDLKKGYKVRVEGKVLQVIGGNDEGNEFMLTAGVSMPFGTQNPVKKNVPIVKRPIKAPVRVQLTGPKVSVIHSNNNECSIKISAPDLDRDGVANSMDQCPATPCSFTVDNYGCPVRTTLKINFASASSIIKLESQGLVKEFAQFLLKNKGSTVKITGHTDSIGTASSNLRLSHRRVNAVIHALTAYGVSPSRLEAFGKGESMPLATNKTVAGRALNRRIEAELFYSRGR